MRDEDQPFLIHSLPLQQLRKFVVTDFLKVNYDIFVALRAFGFDFRPVNSYLPGNGAGRLSNGLYSRALVASCAGCTRAQFAFLSGLAVASVALIIQSRTNS